MTSRHPRHSSDRTARRTMTSSTWRRPGRRMSLLHFTSGTTGAPLSTFSGVVVAHYATGHFALPISMPRTSTGTADPGWVTGRRTA